ALRAAGTSSLNRGLRKVHGTTFACCTFTRECATTAPMSTAKKTCAGPLPTYARRRAAALCGACRFTASAPTPRSASEAPASVESHSPCGAPRQRLRWTCLPRQADPTPAGRWREQPLQRRGCQTRPSPPPPPRSGPSCGTAEPTIVDTPEYPHHAEKEAAVPLRRRD